MTSLQVQLDSLAIPKQRMYVPYIDGLMEKRRDSIANAWSYVSFELSHLYIDEVVQKRWNSITNTMENVSFCTNALIGELLIQPWTVKLFV